MPIILINTNLPKADIPLSVLKDITDGAAEIFGVEAKGFLVIVNGDCLQMFGGTSEPNALAFVYKAQRFFRPETTEMYASKLTDLILGRIAVPRERFYMLLQDAPDYATCYKGKTVVALMNGK